MNSLKIKSSLLKSTSGDAFLLTFVKFITMAVSLLITRLLSEHLSVYDYGTYSQVLLIVSTVSSITILGMMDGVNFFFSSESDFKKREAYVVTIFTLQFVVSTLTGCAVLLSNSLIIKYFDNPDIKRLLVFAALLPLMQNLLAMSQVLLVSVGKARLLAIRNFVVSVVKLIAVLIVITIVNNVSVVLFASLILDIAQIAFFWMIIRKNGCKFSLSALDIRLTGKILSYCVPMAVFVTVNSINRDIDKYLISAMTDTETLAIYSNASKPLPFDIIMLSFCTVLVPKLTKMVSAKNNDSVVDLYKKFLEITYVSNGIIYCAAIVVAPQLMEFFYSDKYTSGLSVFVIYIFVDLFRFTNITLILSAAGKTKWLMSTGIVSLVFNALTNIAFYNLFGIIGPAIATVLTIVLLGVLMFIMNAKVLNVKIKDFFSIKYLIAFSLESIIFTILFTLISSKLASMNLHYFIIILISAGAYGVVMAVLNGKHFIYNIKQINKLSNEV